MAYGNQSQTQALGTAAQYDIGTSGPTIGLLDTNWVKTGTTEFSDDVSIDDPHMLYFGALGGPSLRKAVALDGIQMLAAGGARFLAFQFGAIYLGGAGNMFFQGNPLVTGYTILEDDAGLGLILGTSLNTPVYIIPNRGSVAAAQFSTTSSIVRNTVFLERVAVAGDQTIAVGDPSVQEYTGAGGNTWNLPSLASSNAGSTSAVFTIKNAGSGNLTVQRAGADTIFTTITGQTSFVLAAGEAVDVRAGSAQWLVC